MGVGMSTSEADRPVVPEGYQRLDDSERRAAPNAELLGPADPSETLRVSILLRRRTDGPRLDDVGRGRAVRASRYVPMSQEEFASKYGAHPDDLERVVEFARSAQLIVLEANAARRTVVVTGTVAQVNKAFGVTLNRYQRPWEGHDPRRRDTRGARVLETYRSQEGFTYVPQNLAEIIVGVVGLDNRSLSRRAKGPGTPQPTQVTVPEVTQLYNFPAPVNPKIAGQTIGIIEPIGLPGVTAPTGFTGQGGGYLQSDLDSYFASIGQTPPTPIPISADGTNNQTLALTTTIDAKPFTDVLTFANTDGLLQYSSVYSAGVAITNNFVSAPPTPTTVSLAYPLTNDVPAGTTIYFNLDPETTLDICIAASAAPGAQIAVYFSTDDYSGWMAFLKRAIFPDAGDFPRGVSRPSVLSSSWLLLFGDDSDGLNYASITQLELKNLDEAFGEAALLMDVTICNASGDDGSDDYLGAYLVADKYAHVNYPASDPNVLAVGGTTLLKYQPPNPQEPIWVEYAWGATGGGVSAFFTVPNWQDNAGVPNSVNLSIPPTWQQPTTGRGVPDVAANADPNSGYGIYVGGQAQVWGGTSAAAPLWAGLIAVLNSNLTYNLGFVNTALYEIGAAAFNPISPLWPDPAYPLLANCPASNAADGIPGYPTGPGWDACTGWGSPNGTALLQAIKALQTQQAQQEAAQCAGIIPALKRELLIGAKLTSADFATISAGIQSCSLEGYLSPTETAEAENLLQELEKSQQKVAEDRPSHHDIGELGYRL
jgi:subtilase family serine protease